jgi:hypothetical protein
MGVQTFFEILLGMRDFGEDMRLCVFNSLEILIFELFMEEKKSRGERLKA